MHSDVPALGWPWVAQALQNCEPDPKLKRQLGLAWLWPRPGLLMLQWKQMYLELKAHHLNPVRGRSASSDVSSNISPSPLYIPPYRR